MYLLRHGDRRRTGHLRRRRRKTSGKQICNVRWPIRWTFTFTGRRLRSGLSLAVHGQRRRHWRRERRREASKQCYIENGTFATLLYRPLLTPPLTNQLLTPSDRWHSWTGQARSPACHLANPRCGCLHGSGYLNAEVNRSRGLRTNGATTDPPFTAAAPAAPAAMRMAMMAEISGLILTRCHTVLRFARGTGLRAGRLGWPAPPRRQLLLLLHCTCLRIGFLCRHRYNFIYCNSLTGGGGSGGGAMRTRQWRIVQVVSCVRCSRIPRRLRRLPHDWASTRTRMSRRIVGKMRVGW